MPGPRYPCPKLKTASNAKAKGGRLSFRHPRTVNSSSRVLFCIQALPSILLGPSHDTPPPRIPLQSVPTTTSAQQASSRPPPQTTAHSHHRASTGSQSTQALVQLRSTDPRRRAPLTWPKEPNDHLPGPGPVMSKPISTVRNSPDTPTRPATHQNKSPGPTHLDSDDVSDTASRDSPRDVPPDVWIARPAKFLQQDRRTARKLISPETHHSMWASSRLADRAADGAAMDTRAAMGGAGGPAHAPSGWTERWTGRQCAAARPRTSPRRPPAAVSTEL
jgi:hypothetical protein